MKRQQEIRHVQKLSARLDEDSSKLACSLAQLSAGVGQRSPALLVSGGLLGGFCAGRVFRAVRSGPLRRVYRLLLLARGWAGRLSLARVVTGAAASGVQKSPGMNSQDRNKQFGTSK
ncbi:MAG: hypothetical protein Hals2KO_07660 [Halioglobus sp.]